MLTILHRKVKDKEVQRLDTFRVGSWVILEDPTKEEQQQLKAMIPDVDLDLIADALDPHEVPRVEEDENIVYFYTRVPYQAGRQITTQPLLVAIGETFLLTVSRRELPSIASFKEGTHDFYTSQKAKLFFQVFFTIIKEYEQFLTMIRKEVQRSSVSFETISNKDIMRFVRFESTLNDFLSALIPTNVSLNNLLSGNYITLYETDKDLVEDLFLSSKQLIESCRTNMSNISNIRNAYSTIMTNNLNRVIKLLTALTIVLTIPTMIASFFGMNVPVPFANAPGAFSMIVILSALVSLAIFWFLVKDKWF